MSNPSKTLSITDADLPKQASVFASINVLSELVLEYLFEDDNSPSRNFEKRAVVDKQDTARMAQHYGIKIESSPSHADEVFAKALDVILDSGIKYRFKNLS